MRKGSVLIALALAVNACSAPLSESDVTGTWTLWAATADGEPWEIVSRPGTPLTVTYSIDGTVQGENACNNYHGTYGYDGSLIHDVATDAGQCPNDPGREGTENMVLFFLWQSEPLMPEWSPDRDQMTWSVNDDSLTWVKDEA